ncbi:MAG TPA: molybdenum-binding protein [Lachnospiraceae bacterium]|nr:molybdenum-binding protein [Lachnospiraceae bacterium]
MKTKLRVTLITDENEKFYGPGVQDLLAGIGRYGSVKEACAAMGLSYSKGRRILKHAEAVLGYLLVVRQQGGAAGGSAHLTPEAEDFMKRYQHLTDTVSEYALQQLHLFFP